MTTQIKLSDGSSFALPAWTSKTIAPFLKAVAALILFLAPAGWASAAAFPGNHGASLAREVLPLVEVSSRYYTPGRGSAERRAIMDAARGPVSRELGQTVIFVVQTLRTDGNWAYLQAEPRNPDGSAVNWYNTPFARDWANDMMSDVIMVLLRRDGGGFIVVDYVIGPTDVYWYGWLGTYGLPEALFYSP